jgi:hypothetical protein
MSLGDTLPVINKQRVPRVMYANQTGYLVPETIDE